ncbi:uncharacterized protein LOC120486323 isoform X6 [Pimephales promelas]|uniref:uncharacterized protein LOC120486323 isoform X6 n=1 Tax=Pimephales promelas TaxID=90988 RepID=UPI001955AEEB|nr:uncharacterized protein LOC120486323 isoform X6 [Pimephales promelas]
MFPVQQKTTLEKYNLSMRLEKVANNCLLIANCVHNIFVLQAELTELSEYYLQIYLRYVVLNFIEQNEVEVAPSSWLEWIDGVLFCYWPNSNVGTKVKKCAIRDEHLWTKYAVRVFSDTDNYNLARYRVQKAMETSHVEDSDENSVRKIIPPRRFREEEIQPRRAQHFQEDSESSQGEINELSSLRAKKTQKRSRSTPIRSESEEPDEDEVQPITKITKRSILPEAPRFSSPSSQLQPHQSISANFQNQGSVNDPQSLRDGACSKAYPHQKSQSVEEMIAVTLKHAPDRAKTANQVRSQQEGFPSE